MPPGAAALGHGPVHLQSLGSRRAAPGQTEHQPRRAGIERRPGTRPGTDLTQVVCGRAAIGHHPIDPQSINTPGHGCGVKAPAQGTPSPGAWHPSSRRPSDHRLPRQGGPQHQGLAGTTAAAQMDVLRIDTRPHQDRFPGAGQIGSPLNRAQGMAPRLTQPAIEPVGGHMHHPIAQPISGWPQIHDAHQYRHSQGHSP